MFVTSFDLFIPSTYELIPETLLPYPFIPLPKATRLVPKVSIELSPVKNSAINPPELGIFFANSASALPALAALSIDSTYCPIPNTDSP